MRGTPAARGYGAEHRDRFRAGVLQRDDWTCVLCGAEAKVADHYPLTRRELVKQGLAPVIHGVDCPPGVLLICG
jgi:5-methylcytosine-specific restriction protein A